ncbi:MAG: protein jag, partial [Bryobacteraceae bacterium]
AVVSEQDRAAHRSERGEETQQVTHLPALSRERSRKMRNSGAMPQPYVREGNLDREAAVQSLRGWLDSVLPATGFKLRYEIRSGAAAAPPEGSEFEHPEITVVFSGPDEGLLLERGAELLLSLEYLAVRSLRLDPPFFDRIRFDSADYRAMRIAELKLSARVAADRVRETRQPFRFNAMAARERRIVHLALKDLPGIRTSSEGDGEERQVVIFPADKT